MDKYMIDLDQILDELEAEESLQTPRHPFDSRRSNVSVNIPADTTSSLSTVTNNVLREDETSADITLLPPPLEPTTSAAAPVKKDAVASQTNPDSYLSSLDPSINHSSLPLDNTPADENHLWSYDSPPLSSQMSYFGPTNVHKVSESNNEDKIHTNGVADSVCDADGDEELLRKVLEDVDEYEKYNSTPSDQVDLNFDLPQNTYNDVNVSNDDFEAELNAIINSVSLSSNNFNDSSSVLSSIHPHSSSSSTIAGLANPTTNCEQDSPFDRGNTDASSVESGDKFKSNGNDTLSTCDNETSSPSDLQVSCEASGSSDAHHSASSHSSQTDCIDDTASSSRPLKVARPNSLNLPTSRSQNSRHVPVDDLVEESSASNVNDTNVNPSPPLVTVSVLDDEPRIGYTRPFWVPDNEALSCMRCDTKFTVIKRRHHCRACGKVLCNNCCNMKAKLAYLDFQEDRVCLVCYEILSSDDCYSDEASSLGAGAAASSSQVNLSSVNPAPLPPGVLKKPNQPAKQPKQVVFSDGIRPGGDLTEPDGPSTSSLPKKTISRLRSPPVEVNSLPVKSKKSRPGKSIRTIIPDSGLPPVLDCPALAAEPSLVNLISQLTAGNVITFVVLKNLHIQVQLTKLTCCCNCQVWNFSSRGLATVGQDEILLLLERVDGEMDLPKPAFRLITSVYDSAFKGLVYNEMSHILFPEGMFNCKEYCGFLFIRPTDQCLQNVIMPANPFLVALLIQRSEVPWAKIFPLRLLLRLGLEFSTFPYPIVSFRNRKAAYCEIGHTILKVLADFRNFQYNITVLPGVVIRKTANKYVLSLPRNRYDAIMKVLNNKNTEHVLSLGGNLDMTADAHYACTQNEEGQYNAQVWAKNENEQPTTIGASFIVFSCGFKSTKPGLNAKVNLVEDGVLVQVPLNTLTLLKNSLKDMNDFTIECGKTGDESSEIVVIEWVADDLYFNVGVVSPIDGRSLQGISSVRIHNSTDYANSKYTIRWTDVFFIENRDPGRRDSTDPTKVAGIIGQIFCQAMTLHLDSLVDLKINKIGLRVSIDPEQVGFEVGSNGKPLPPSYASDLDGALIPVITSNILASIDALLVLELFFHILLK